MNTTRLITAILGLCLGAAAIAQDTADDTGIPPQPLNKALEQFADQSGLQIIYVADLAEGKETPGAKPNLSDTETLDQLLASTGLKYEFLNDNTVTVQAAADDAGGDSDSGNGRTAGATPRPMMMAQAAVEQSQASQRTETDSDEDEEKRPLEEIIVTGTLIRGSAPTGAPLMTIDRSDIIRSGFSTTQQVIQALPQTLAAGPNELTTNLSGTGGGAVANVGQGSSINLRGLGTDKTLTLINGRRVAAGGTNGSFVDISMIPVSSVERIEVLTDGASALYGSDAVAGVVNIILRQDFDGAETFVQFGTITPGDHKQYRASQLLGKDWKNGSALFSYEYFNQSLLLAADRDFAASSDLTPFGGDNFNLQLFGNPGTILAGDQFFAVPVNQDGTSLAPIDLMAGTQNSHNLREGTSLLPSQDRHSVLATAKQELAEWITLFADGRYSIREFERRQVSRNAVLAVPDSNPFFVDPVGDLSSVLVFYNFIDEYGPQLISGEVESYGATVGADIDLWTDWQLEIFGVYSREETFTRLSQFHNSLLLDAALADPDPMTAFNPFGDGANTNPATISSVRGLSDSFIDSDTWSMNAKADGTLFKIPGGDLKLAVGMEFREDALRSGGKRFSSSAAPVPIDESDFDRNVLAGYGELFVPLVGAENRRPGVESLSLSAAVRVEDHSDFGATTNPKVGGRWSPTNWLSFRGTWGTAFRAPLLTNLDLSNKSITAKIASDPTAPTGQSVQLILAGFNPDLGPEEATTWTVGFDITPDHFPSLTAAVTYFDIDLTGRISSIPSNAALLREDEFAPAITRNPDAAVVQPFLDDPLYEDFGFGFTASDIDVIVDGRLKNLSLTNIEGFDFSLSYTRDAGELGTISAGVNGSYIFKFQEAFTSTAPVVDVVDTFERQVDFRARGNVSWDYDGLTSSIFVNYTDGYRDDVSNPNRRIDPCTTVDVAIGYDTGDSPSNELMRNLRFSMSATNLFDNDPPFVNNPNGAGFDPVNADPRGRFISFQVRKAW